MLSLHYGGMFHWLSIESKEENQIRGNERMFFGRSIGMAWKLDKTPKKWDIFRRKKERQSSECVHDGKCMRLMDRMGSSVNNWQSFTPWFSYLLNCVCALFTHRCLLPLLSMRNSRYSRYLKWFWQNEKKKPVQITNKLSFHWCIVEISFFTCTFYTRNILWCNQLPLLVSISHLIEISHKTQRSFFHFPPSTWLNLW